MKTFRLTLLSGIAFIPALCLADSKVQVHVDVQNAPTDPTMRVPTPGDYTFMVTQKKVQVVLPSGSIMIFDFDKKFVSTLDPIQKTFTQLKLDDYLALGDKVASTVGNRYSAKSTVSFDPTAGQDSKPVVGLNAAPYSVDIQALVSTASRGSGGRGGRGLGGLLGGGIFGGGGGGRSSGRNDSDYSGSGSRLASTGCKVGGELWMANSALGDCDRYELSMAEACTLMRFAPGLKGLSDKIKKANLTLLAASYSVSIYDNTGQPPAKPPFVSFETKSNTYGVFDASLFTIPSYYIKVEPPTSPLGTKS